MTRLEFLRWLEGLIEEEPGTLTGAESLKDATGWDSLAVLQFIAKVDEQFDMTLPPRQIAGCRTFDDLIALLGDRITA